MALTKVSGGILDPGINVAGIVTATGFDGPFVGGSDGINAGVGTFTGLDVNGNGDISGNLVVGGNLTANGDFTTLNTTLREVEILHVDTNSSEPAGIITQTGAGDILRLYDGSTQVVTVLDTGEVGIGITNPSAKLQVANGHVNVSSGYSLQWGDSHERIEQSDGKIEFFTNNGQQMTLHGSNLGIGTDNPDHNLHVFQNAGDSVITIESTGNGNDSALEFIRTSSGGNSMGAGSIYVTGNTGGSEAKMQFGVGHNISHGTLPRMTIMGNGEVGIGTDNPNHELTVYGDEPHFRLTHTGSTNKFNALYTQVDGTGVEFNSYQDGTGTRRPFIFKQYTTEVLRIESNGQILYQSNSGDNQFISKRTGSADSNGDFFFHLKAQNSGGTNVGELGFHRDSATDDSRFIIKTRNSGGSSQERLRITSSGEVKIPTGSNSTSRLTFGGGVNIYHDNNFKIENYTGYLKLQCNNQINIDGSSIYLRNGGGTNRWIIDSSGHFLPGAVGSYNIGSTGAEIGHVYLADDKRVYFGTDQDLSMYSSGTNGFIDNGTGYLLLDTTSDLVLRADADVYLQPASGENAVKATGHGSVDLYYDQSTYTTPKLKTSATGITVDGEVAASQDYPNFRPTLDFNFAAQKKLDPRITYQRSGPASFTDEFGKVVLVGDNTPRFDHDPVTRESKGLLVEPSRTNFMKYSDEFAIDNGQTGGNWDAIGGESNYTRVSDTTETKDPTGITNHASKLTFTGSSATLRGYWYSGAADGAVSKTYSVYLKRATSNTTSVKLDIGDQGSTTYTITDEWKRYSVTTSSAGNGNFVDMHVTSGANTAYYAWGAQIEAGSYATSYIPTSSAAVVRGADFTVLLEDDFTDAISQTEGTLIAEYDNVTSDGYVLSLDGSGGNKIGMVNSSSYQLMGQAGGSSQGTTDNGTLLSGTNRFALAYKLNDTAISINGNTATVDTNYTLPTTTFMSIGHRQYQYDHLGSCIARVMYYNTRLPNSQLKTLSTR